MLETAMRFSHVLPLLLAGLFSPGSHAQDVPPQSSLSEQQPANGDWADSWGGKYWARGPGENGIACTISAQSVNFFGYTCFRSRNESFSLQINGHADGVLELSHQPDAKPNWIQYVQSRAYLVRWGDRRYIVPDSQISYFVEQVRVRARAIARVPQERPSDKVAEAQRNADKLARRNVGPRFLYSLVHFDDLHMPAFGLPEVPGGWAAFLDHEPIVASITTVLPIDNDMIGSEHPRTFAVTFYVEPDSPLFAGQELFWRGLMGHVQSIDASTATARFVLPPESAAATKNSEAIPRIGETVATLARDSAPLDYWPLIESE